MEQKTTVQKMTFDLIDGTFLPNETMEIINHIIQKKINFHELRNFSEKIRFGIQNDNSGERIIALTSYQKQLASYVEQLDSTDQILDIKATISIKIHQIQILAPLTHKNDSIAHFYIHRKNGFYINTIFDKLVGALNSSKYN
ncbi:hypothetical protein QO200_04670 [Flavobacterium sp. Arc3]|jgi:hypothetical protein|uniref:hypothetical protein n=1 Tax=Flavobacterium sp. Arc3 TaxID=3046686 RepID=UPI00352DFFE9